MVSKLTDTERKNRVEVLYFPKSPGHIAIKIHAIRMKFMGFYLSQGSNADGDYASGVLRDKQTYGSEYRSLFLDLPEDIDLSQLLTIHETFFPSAYRLTSNNCADEALRLLQDKGNGLGYPFFQNIGARLMTTPVYIATQAWLLALEQNENIKQDILRKLPTSEEALDDFTALLIAEKKRLAIESDLAKMSSAIIDWKSLNFPKKIFMNLRESFDLKKKREKILYLNKMIHLLDQDVKSPLLYQMVFDQLSVGQKEVGGRTATALQKCINYFPLANLPGGKEKLDFLLHLKNVIKQNEFLFKKQTIFWKSLPDGIGLIKAKLAVLDNKLAEEHIQKIFFEVQQILHKKAHENGTRTDWMQKFYREFYIKSGQWRKNHVEFGSENHSRISSRK